MFYNTSIRSPPGGVWIETNKQANKRGEQCTIYDYKRSAKYGTLKHESKS